MADIGIILGVGTVEDEGGVITPGHRGLARGQIVASDDEHRAAGGRTQLGAIAGLAPAETARDGAAHCARHGGFVRILDLGGREPSVDDCQAFRLGCIRLGIGADAAQVGDVRAAHIHVAADPRSDASIGDVAAGIGGETIGRHRRGQGARFDSAVGRRPRRRGESGRRAAAQPKTRA